MGFMALESLSVPRLSWHDEFSHHLDLGEPRSKVISSVASFG
jgi:hypothetical protein